MAGKLDNLIVAQQTSQAQIVGWRFIPFGVEDPASAKVRVYRSEVENTGFELIASVRAGRGWYYDEDADIMNRWATVFYKLELVIGNEVTAYPPIRLNSAADVQSRSLARHIRTYIRLAGLPVLVYQFLQSGERCPDCWDSVLRKVTRSNCLSCFGTGYMRGYHEPILTLAVLGVEGKTNQVGERLEQEITIEMLFANYPVLRPGDIIYEIDSGKRYRAQQVLPVEKHRALIQQSVLGYGIQTSEIEHNLQIPDLSELTPVLRRTRAPQRLVSRTDGESFGYDTFTRIPF